MKNLIPLLSVAILLTSCHALKPIGKPSTDQVDDSRHSQANPRFLDDITINGQKQGTRSGKTEKMPDLRDPHPPSFYINNTFDIERGNKLQFKYSILLDVEVEQLGNLDLYRFIDDWWGTPYRYGGLTQRGVDCSAFVQSLYASVYGVALPRIAREQKEFCEEEPVDDLTEGDLLFFNTTGGVSHVGIYLHNRKFVHAATSGGVMISDMDESYWSRRFLGAGKVKNESFAAGHTN